MRIGVPKQIRVVMEYRIPSNTVDLPFADGQRIMFATHGCRKLSDQRSPLVERGHGHLALAHENRSRFALRLDRQVDVRDKDAFSLLEGFTLIQKLENPRTHMDPFTQPLADRLVPKALQP